MVLDFVNAHPGHELTAGTIGRELGRSPGAVQNNLAYLLTQGLLAPASDDGTKVTALTNGRAVAADAPSTNT
jgi:DNA-binding IclR family transcriptional regulator